MTKYKRWILLLTALTVFVVHIESLKATSLIHAGKFSKLLNTTTSTTSSSTTEEPTSDHLREILDEMPTDSDDEKFVEVNGTKIALTGIPQIDYVWDPNLPRELNGFNLSSYPFIDSMPAEEDIGFDCEDKINGFYASIKFSCQIYHHCLYGVRSDFICANFTAFDQKTFICHFASEVDCKNSYKYWNRNDDLYKATTEKSTTSSGVAPLFDRNLYKRPPPGTETRNLNAKSNQPLQPLVTKDTFKPEPPPQLPPARGVIGDVDYIAPAVQRPARPLRRPYRRRRPQIDYYYYDDEEYEDDFYDDRGRRRQQRPRNRRPLYDDYRDTRRPLNDDDFDDYEYERRPYRSRNRSESRRTGDDRRKHEDRRFDDRRRPYVDDRKPLDDRKRPEDERRSYDDRRYSDDRRTIDDRKRYDEERSQSDDRKYSRRKNPVDDPIDDKRRVPDRHESEKRQTADEPEEKLAKPLGSIFDRARPSPRIPRPVPLNEKNKFAYKHSDKPSHAESEKKDKDEEYYEEYEDAPLSSSTTTSTTTTTTAKPTTTKYSPRLKTLTTPLARKPSTTSTLAPETEYYEDEYYDTTAKPVETSTAQKLSDRALLFNARRAAIENLTQPPAPSAGGSSTLSYQAASVPDNFRLNRFKSPSAKLINETAIRDNAQKTSLPFVEETTSTTTTTTTRKPLPSISYNSKKFANQQTIFDPTTTETPKAATTESISHIINPRFNNRPEESVELEPVTDEKDQKYLMRVIKRPFLPSRGGNPYKGRGLQPVGPASHQLSDQAIDSPSFTSQGSELSTFTSEGSQVEPSLNNFNEPEPQTPLRTTLDDIYNEDRGISGFSFSSLPNADKDGFRAQSQKSIQKAEAPLTTSTTTTTTEAPQYDYEEVEYDYK